MPKPFGYVQESLAIFLRRSFDWLGMTGFGVSGG